MPEKYHMYMNKTENWQEYKGSRGVSTNSANRELRKNPQKLETHCEHTTHKYMDIRLLKTSRGESIFDKYLNVKNTQFYK